MEAGNYSYLNLWYITTRCFQENRFILIGRGIFFNRKDDEIICALSQVNCLEKLRNILREN